MLDQSFQKITFLLTPYLFTMIKEKLIYQMKALTLTTYLYDNCHVFVLKNTRTNVRIYSDIYTKMPISLL